MFWGNSRISIPKDKALPGSEADVLGGDLRSTLLFAKQLFAGKSRI